MTYAVDPRVDDYIDALPEWQQAICREVRDLVHAADPEVAETVKFTVRPYFVLAGNICALLAAKDQVAKTGWPVLNRDTKIMRRRDELVAYRRAGVHMFYLPGEARVAVLVELVSVNLAEICRSFGTNRPVVGAS